MSGMMSYHSLQLLTTSYQTSIQKNLHFCNVWERCSDKPVTTHQTQTQVIGTEDQILDLELLSNIFQTQIHNLEDGLRKSYRGQQPVRKPNIEVGDLVLVRDHTSKCFMPKYKVDFRVVRVPRQQS